LLNPGSYDGTTWLDARLETESVFVNVHGRMWRFQRLARLKRRAIGPAHGIDFYVHDSNDSVTLADFVEEAIRVYGQDEINRVAFYSKLS
jgi:hypothetical protein